MITDDHGLSRITHGVATDSPDEPRTGSVFDINLHPGLIRGSTGMFGVRPWHIWDHPWLVRDGPAWSVSSPGVIPVYPWVNRG